MASECRCAWLLGWPLSLSDISQTRTSWTRTVQFLLIRVFAAGCIAAGLPANHACNTKHSGVSLSAYKVKSLDEFQNLGQKEDDIYLTGTFSSILLYLACLKRRELVLGFLFFLSNHPNLFKSVEYTLFCRLHIHIFIPNWTSMPPPGSWMAQKD